MQTTLPPPADPRRRDEIRVRAAAASRETGPAKRVARALGISLRWQQVANSGERAGPPQRVLEYFDGIARSANPWPMVAAVIETVQEAQLASGGFDPREVYRSLCEAETRAQADGDVLQMELRERWDAETLMRWLEVSDRHAWKLLGMRAAVRLELRKLG